MQTHIPHIMHALWRRLMKDCTMLPRQTALLRHGTLHFAPLTLVMYDEVLTGMTPEVCCVMRAALPYEAL